MVEDFESRPHKAVSFLVESKKGDAGMERAEVARGLTWLQWRKITRKKQKRKRQRRRELEEGKEERTIKSEIAQEVVAGIKEKASVHEDAKANALRTAGQSVNQVEVQWDELQVMQKAPEPAVHERMTKGEEVKCTKEKKKGRSTEEMKVKANILLEEDTEEMIKWRSLSQEEIGQWWKNLAENIEAKFQDKYKIEEGGQRCPRWNGGGRAKTRKYRIRRW